MLIVDLELENIILDYSINRKKLMKKLFKSIIFVNNGSVFLIYCVFNLTITRIECFLKVNDLTAMIFLEYLTGRKK
jgi:hypothetical protein